MTDIPHLGFIVASYALTTVAIATMIGAILWDYGALKSQLRALEEKRRGGGDGSSP